MFPHSYYHVQVKHQGRHFTEGAIRPADLWMVGCKRRVGSVVAITFFRRYKRSD